MGGWTTGDGPAAPTGPFVKRRKAREAEPKAVVPWSPRSAPVRTASAGLTRTETIRTRDAGPDRRSDATPRAATSKRTIATNQTTRASARARERRRPAAPAASSAASERKTAVRRTGPLTTGVGKDHEAGGAEADRFGRHERGEQAECLAEEDVPAGDRLREEELRRPPLGNQRLDADQERRERDEEEDQLDEGNCRPREVLDAAPAREDVARRRDGEREEGEDDREDLRPARPDGQEQLLPRTEEDRRRAGRVQRGSHRPAPKTVTALSGGPPRAP